MLEKEREINRDHYREIVAWSMLALKRLAGDDPQQQLKFLAAC
ncbi:MAG: hypothetical protein NT013_00300 [Planctomycetia bacterium]|nr:hypothetical protein [Planctomycetia bacterium]